MEIANADLVYGVFTLSYGRDLAQSVSDLQYNEHDSVDGGISMTFEALKPDLFKQSVQIRW